MSRYSCRQEGVGKGPGCEPRVSFLRCSGALLDAELGNRKLACPMRDDRPAEKHPAGHDNIACPAVSRGFKF